jgi:hypothetical protein
MTNVSQIFDKLGKSGKNLQKFLVMSFICYHKLWNYIAKAVKLCDMLCALY